MRSRLGLLLPGARVRRSQIAVHAEAWLRANEAALAGPGRLWVVLGDSTAQAIGASGFDRGYVRAVHTWLDEQGGGPWRVVNLSRSGARAADVVAEQLPALADLRPDLVSCAVGANDLLRRTDLRAALGEVSAALPEGSLLANLPHGMREGVAQVHNRFIAELVTGHDLRLVDLWSATAGPWRGKFAGDYFHPNDVGYRDWTAAFLAALTGP